MTDTDTIDTTDTDTDTDTTAVAGRKLAELNAELDEKHKVLDRIFTEAGDSLDLTAVKEISGTTEQKVEEIGRLNRELSDLYDQARVERIKLDARTRTAEVGDYLNEPVVRPFQPDSPTVHKSFGELAAESSAIAGVVKVKGGGDGPAATIDVDVKTLMTTAAGWAPETTRTGRVVLDAQRPPQLLDIIPMTTTQQTAIVYMEETTFTNAAVEKAEGAAFGEAALVLTERSDPVRKIPVFLPVTDEQLEDEPQVRGYIDGRLTLMLEQRLDSQILNGNGTAPNLEGILHRTGLGTQAKGSNPSMDAIRRGRTKAKVTGRSMPDAILIHSNDWQEIELTRTADGLYILGNPGSMITPRLWGLPVVENEAITEGTALVGDFGTHSELAFKRGIDIQVSNSHGSYFVEGKQAIRADLRAALVVYRPAAFCQVTGI